MGVGADRRRGPLDARQPRQTAIDRLDRPKIATDHRPRLHPSGETTRWTLNASPHAGGHAAARAAVAQTPLVYGWLRLNDRGDDINDIDRSLHVSDAPDVTNTREATSTTPSKEPQRSVGNQLLIAAQHPAAVRVAGFRAWLDLDTA